jgi:hypothetical protein
VTTTAKLTDEALREAGTLVEIAARWLPGLTAYGVTGPNADREGAIWQTEEERARDRVALFENLDMVAHAAAWIRANMVPRNTIILGRSSYGLKHDVERAVGIYITNGAFIAAAIGLG